MPYDFDGFKRDHYARLAKACDELRLCYERVPLGEAFSREQIDEIVAKAKAVIAFRPLLPNAGAGVPEVNKLAAKAKDFAKRFAGKPPTEKSFWAAQAIASSAFNIHLYMSAICECDDDGPAQELVKRPKQRRK